MCNCSGGERVNCEFALVVRKWTVYLPWWCGGELCICSGGE